MDRRLVKHLGIFGLLTGWILIVIGIVHINYIVVAIGLILIFMLVLTNPYVKEFLFWWVPGSKPVDEYEDLIP